MVLALGAQSHWFESCSDLIILPCICSFVSKIVTDFIRKTIGVNNEFVLPEPHNSNKIT